jgi:hypothetical protein
MAWTFAALSVRRKAIVAWIIVVFISIYRKQANVRNPMLSRRQSLHADHPAAIRYQFRAGQISDDGEHLVGINGIDLLLVEEIADRAFVFRQDEALAIEVERVAYRPAIVNVDPVTLVYASVHFGSR